jgi:hypothetical protein
MLVLGLPPCYMVLVGSGLSLGNMHLLLVGGAVVAKGAVVAHWEQWWLIGSSGGSLGSRVGH